MPAIKLEDLNDELGGDTDEDTDEEVTYEGNSDRDMDDLIDKLVGTDEHKADKHKADEHKADEHKADEHKADEHKAKKSRAAKSKAEEQKPLAANDPGEWFMGHYFPTGVPGSTRMEMEIGATRVAEAMILHEARVAREAAEAAAEK